MDRFGAVKPWQGVEQRPGIDREELGAGAAGERNGHHSSGKEGLDRIPPSRAKVISAIGESLVKGSGPILLTGEPGSGKTWVADNVCQRLDAAIYRPLKIDLSPAVGPIEFHRLIQYRLGLEPGFDIAEARGSVENALSEDFANGLRAILIIEEAHSAADSVFEELRVLENRRGRPEGFWSILLIGQSALTRRLHSRKLAGVSNRIAGRVHLRTFDIVEFADSIGVRESLMSTKGIDGQGVTEEIDHGYKLAEIDPAASALDPDTESQSEPTRSWNPAPVAPARPPLQESEGMIEVGWDAPGEPDSDPELASKSRIEQDPETSSKPVVERPATIDEQDVPIHDHYTALQAWNEWSRRQGRGFDNELTEPPSPNPSASSSPESSFQEGLPTGRASAAEAGTEPSPTFWAEGQQEFAPYSQLFSRLRGSRESR